MSSRLFRANNHLLWMGILVTFAVTVYIGATYWTDETPSTSQVAPRSEQTTQQQRAAATQAPRKTTRETPSSKASPLTADTSANDTSQPPARRVTFAPSPKKAATPRRPHTPYVFLDIAKQDFLKDPFVGKVVIELYTRDAPRTTHNFAELCRDKKYVNTPFHRIIKDFMIQGGDIVNQDGTGTYSVYGGEGSTFEDEAFVHPHDQPGLLSMANSGPNTNGSQFFITMGPAPHLDGKHVVFGRVVEGLEHLHDLEREVTDPNDRPIRKCYIMNCGVAERPTATAKGGLNAASLSQPPTPPAAQSLERYDNAATQSPLAEPTAPEPAPFQL